MSTVRPQTVLARSTVLSLALLLGVSCAEQPLTAPAAREPDFGKGGTGGGGSATTIEVALPLAYALDMDESGRVVGIQSGGPVDVWTPDSWRGTTGSLTPITTLSWAGAINEAGQVLGVGLDGAPTVWDAGHTLTLPVPPQADPARAPNTARGSNLSDHSSPGDVFWVVGSCDNAEDEEGPCFGGRAIVWWMAGTGPLMSVTTTDLLPELGFAASSVNRSGVVVGWDADRMPTKWIAAGPGNWTRVALGLPAGSWGGRAIAVNAHGATVGSYSAVFKGNLRCYGAVLWPSGSTAPLPLPTMKAYECSWANDINDAGYIVGRAEKWSYPYAVQAVLWKPQAGGRYEVIPLGDVSYPVYSLAGALNEPAQEESETSWLEVVGQKGDCRFCSPPVLWKVQVP